MKDDYEIKFWKDWLNADSLKKLELAKSLPIFNFLQIQALSRVSF